MKILNSSITTLFLTLSIFATSFQSQQKTIPQEKHEAEVVLVIVDVIVTKDGEFVQDLAKEEFELYEDGWKIPINSFELITLGERKVEVERIPQSLEKQPHEAQVPKKHLAVIFDGINTWDKDAKKISQDVINELISLIKLGHEVLVLFLSKERGLDVILPFTNNERLIEEAVSLASGSLWMNKFDLLQENSMLKLYLQYLDGEPGDSRTKENLEDWEKATKHIYLLSQKERFEATVGGIFAAMNMIRALPGRKSLLLISNGLTDLSSFNTSASALDVLGGRYGERNIPTVGKHKLDAIHDKIFLAGKFKIFDPFSIMEEMEFKTGDEVINEMIRYANANNISIYTLDAEMFSKYAATGPTAEHFRAEEAIYRDFVREEKIRQVQNLRKISEDTGAKIFRGATKFDTLREVLNTDLNFYYLLSFYPRKAEGDDKYHKIEVKVNRPGVDVRFRKGYTYYSDEETYKIMVASAFYNPAHFKDLPFEADCIPILTDSGKYEAWMNIALPVKEFFLNRFDIVGTKDFDLYFWLKDLKQAEKGFRGQDKTSFTVDSNFLDSLKGREHLYLRFVGSGFKIEQGEYKITFVISNPETKEIGTWDKYITLPKMDKQPAFINCVLGTIENIPERRNEAFLFNKKNGSLEYGQTRFVPRVINKFSQWGDAAYLFVQIYFPQGNYQIHPEFSIADGNEDNRSIKGKLMAESWNKRTKVWSSLFYIDISPCDTGENVLRVVISGAEKGLRLIKELNIKVLR